MAKYLTFELPLVPNDWGEYIVGTQTVSDVDKKCGVATYKTWIKMTPNNYFEKPEQQTFIDQYSKVFSEGKYALTIFRALCTDLYSFRKYAGLPYDDYTEMPYLSTDLIENMGLSKYTTKLSDVYPVYDESLLPCTPPTPEMLNIPEDITDGFYPGTGMYIKPAKGIVNIPTAMYRNRSVGFTNGMCLGEIELPELRYDSQAYKLPCLGKPIVCYTPRSAIYSMQMTITYYGLEEINVLQ